MLRAFVLTAFSLAALCPAAAINENAGTTGFNFLKIGVGARPAALGGAFAAVAGDVEAAAWNPAGLAGIGQRTAAMSLTRYLLDTQAGFVSVALPSPGRVWGFSVSYFSYGEMRKTGQDGQDLGEFGASDLAAYLTVAQPFWRDWLVLGLNLKAVYSTIDEYSSDAYMVDLGLRVRGPLDGMALGASLSNLGAARSGYVGSAKDELPKHFRLGVAHQPAHAPVPLLLLADLNVPNDNDPYLAFGAEIRLGSGLYLRPGYSTQQSGLQGDSPLGLTAGAGFATQRYRLDYAFTSYPDLGDVHRVSVAGAF
jgi:hypothetical protein